MPLLLAATPLDQQPNHDETEDDSMSPCPVLSLTDVPLKFSDPVEEAREDAHITTVLASISLDESEEDYVTTPSPSTIPLSASLAGEFLDVQEPAKGAPPAQEDAYMDIECSQVPREADAPAGATADCDKVFFPWLLTASHA